MLKSFWHIYYSILIKIYMKSTLWRRRFFIEWSMISECIEGHKANFLFKNRNFLRYFLLKFNLIKIWMLISRRQNVFIKMKCDLKGYIYVMERFGNFYPLDQIATLTYVSHGQHLSLFYNLFAKMNYRIK